VIIQDHTVNMPNGNRGHVMLEGIKTLEIRDGFSIAGNQAAFILDHTGNAQPNGNECFMLSQPLSQYGGFQSAVKVRRGTTNLTNAQIDALWCPISLQ
jgi:hypothetical protein